MINLLKRLFGGKAEPTDIKRPTPSSKPKAADKPRIPQEKIDEFISWFTAQTRPAIVFEPVKGQKFAEEGSRLGGPAWLGVGKSWPETDRGVPLELIFQLDCADCASLGTYPPDTILQFFVGRSDLYGCDFENLVTGDFLVHVRQRSAEGAVHAPPPLKIVNNEMGSDYSPFMDKEVRTNGVMLDAKPVMDTIDFSIDGVYDRVAELADSFDITRLEDWIETDANLRPLRHHSGGFPAFTQADITATETGRVFDHVLLRITSDDSIMWGDSGECVFLIRSEDLKAGNFSRVAYSWDCC